jgi:hypothetical protein
MKYAVEKYMHMKLFTSYCSYSKLMNLISEPLTTTTSITDITRTIENLPWYINGADQIGVQREEFTTPDVKVSFRIQFYTRRGNAVLHLTPKHSCGPLVLWRNSLFLSEKSDLHSVEY